MTIDPVTMARFLIMPGAVDLLDAFSRIPEGPLRAATIAQVQAMADAYSGVHGHAPEANDALLLAALNTAEPREAEASPAAMQASSGYTPKNHEEEVIHLRMEGLHPAEIAKRVGWRPMTVTGVLAEAERGGLKFPPFAKKQREPAPGAKPVFPKPYDEQTEHEQRFTRITAKSWGLSLKEYERLQREIVRRRKKGEYPTQIAEDIGQPKHKIAKVIDKAQGAGIVFPELKTGSAARKAMGRNLGGWAAKKTQPEDAPQQAEPPPEAPAINSLGERLSLAGMAERSRSADDGPHYPESGDDGAAVDNPAAALIEPWEDHDTPQSQEETA